MSATTRGLAERARLVLRAHGGRATPSDLLVGLFGLSSAAERWEPLLEGVLAPLSDVRRAPDGTWQIVSPETPRACLSDSLTFVALVSAATGADPWRGRLLAIAAVRVEDGAQVGCFDAIFNPRCRVPRYVVEATRITQAEAEEAPSFGELADELLDYLGDLPLIGLEIRAQADRIGHELSRLDRPGLRNRLLELSELATTAGLDTGKPSLPGLAAAAGLSHPRPYHPATDARVTARLAARLLEMAHSGQLTPAGANSDPADRPSEVLRRPAPPDVPLGPGVYLLEDAAGRLLYVGKARDLRRRVQSYHRRQLGLLRRLEGLAQAAARLETIPARSELEALLMEARLLRRHRPPFNVQHRHRQPAVFLKAELSDERSRLSACREVASDGARYLGPFCTASSAAAALRLVRDLFPALRGRARAGAAARRPQLEAALRFLDGDKDAVLDRLQTEQRARAAAADVAGLSASRALLRRALDFSPDLATRLPTPLPDQLLVLSPAAHGGLLAHVVRSGRLLDCFEAEDERSAHHRAARAGETETRRDGDQEALDEPSIILRWLCALGPEHRVAALPVKVEG